MKITLKLLKIIDALYFIKVSLAKNGPKPK